MENSPLHTKWEKQSSPSHESWDLKAQIRIERSLLPIESPPIKEFPLTISIFELLYVIDVDGKRLDYGVPPPSIAVSLTFL